MTKLHVHELRGLKPDALATYLAALGVMRLLAEQKDANVRGFWRDEHFVLVSELDWEAIERFFVEKEGYTPTPVLAPWNMESGFFSLKPTDGKFEKSDESPDDGNEGADGVATDDDEQADEEGEETDKAVGDPLLNRFASSSAQRFAPFRRAIELARAAISSELRSAEEDARHAHDEFKKASDETRAKHEVALKEVEDAERTVAELKADVEAKKAAVRGVAKGAPEREALKAAQDHSQERVKNAQQRHRALKKRAKEIENELKAEEKRAKKDPRTKKRIADAKARFKEIQAATKDRLIGDLRAHFAHRDRLFRGIAITCSAASRSERSDVQASRESVLLVDLGSSISAGSSTLNPVRTCRVTGRRSPACGVTAP